MFIICIVHTFATTIFAIYKEVEYLNKFSSNIELLSSDCEFLYTVKFL